MTDLLKSGIEWKDRMVRAFLSESAEYVRGNDSYTVAVSYGQTRYEIADSAGVSVGAFVFDFLIAASELALTPQKGDRILVGDKVYLVADFGADGCWRWSDAYHVTRRIHTKEGT